MKRGPVGAVDLRGFRWRLLPAERRLEAEVESARLALARLQMQSCDLDQAERRRSAQQIEQQALALASARHDVFAGAQAMRYLAHLEGERIAAAAASLAMQQRVAEAREACAQRQRQLESVQLLRDAAQREHLQARLRHECREADAAWLALTQLRRCAQLRKGRESE
ncbi:hypothetical protein [Ramlibacter alkalitolerans]|uniref:Flagellar FliJ protein n=1 Tax=Ramlibacter alkalitolerans TaxID=2039631 RepID=A0ABS1JT17_9BURK|nr:hypothetical protein [Ramlibacter alkalitolerans]MBL0427389.1 hypothetical protein [Ramlibacter alkalitolerans]